MRVALVTARESTDLYEDGELLLPALAAAGVEAVAVPWGDGHWASFDGVLVRGCWDYTLARDEFLAWASSVAAVTRLANPPEVLRWNTDKRYLRDLEAAGVGVIPTQWGGATFPEGEFVVKPSVSAGAFFSARYGPGDHAAAATHVARIAERGLVAMVQPFVASVESVGETGTYVFGGEVSHAIRKGSVLEPGRAAEEGVSDNSHLLVGPADVDPGLAELALRVVALAPGPVLYARVDTVPGPGGEPLVIELEATEPYLFLKHHPPAAGRFAAAVARWLSG